MSNDLVAFVHARIEDDENAARAALIMDNGNWYVERDGPSHGTSVRTWGTVHSSSTQLDIAVHIARHDPARVLDEVEVKRRIINRHREALTTAARFQADYENSQAIELLKLAHEWDNIAGLLKGPVLDIASVFSGHPDYRPECRP